MKNCITALFLILFQSIAYSQSHPIACKLSESSFYLPTWASDNEAGIYPANVSLQVYDGEEDPQRNSEAISDWKCAYNLDSKSRFIGLNNLGIGLVNTGSSIDNEECNGFLGGKVGIVVLALNTIGIENIELSWKIRMIAQGDGFPTPREYRIIAQYRLDSTSSWVDLPSTTRYTSFSKSDGDVDNFFQQLPPVCENRDYIQVRWKYYQENSYQGGKRPFLSIDDIKALGNRIDGNNSPQLFIDKQNFDNFGCVLDSYSAIDSLLISAKFLSEDLSIKTGGNFYISLSKEKDYTQSIEISTSNGIINEQYLYIKKMCSDIGIENSQLNLESGSLKTNTPLRGEAYYKIFINELVASNFRSYQDGNFYPDWIELYNPNDINISLRDYYLSDDKNNLTKYKFPVGGSSAISSKAFMLRFADDSRTTNTYLQFNLAKGGESVFLIGKDGKTIIDSVTYNNLKTDISYGRATDGAEKWVKFKKTTPGESNNQGIVQLNEQSAPPIFSANAGKYDKPFELELKSNYPDAKIYYTVDGSEPSIDNLGGSIFEYKRSYSKDSGYVGESYYQPYRTIFYLKPISLDIHQEKNYRLSDANGSITAVPLKPKVYRNNAIVVRAIATEPDKEPSPIVTQTYFFTDNDPIADKFPVISVAINPNEFIGFNEGIAVPGYKYENWRNNASGVKPYLPPANYTTKGREMEINGNIEVFEKNKPYYNSKVGVRLNGNGSKNKPLKGLRFYGRSYYENDKIVYPFFNNLPYEDYKIVILRTSNSYGGTFFKDAFASQITAFDKMDYQEYNPYSVYLNGEYWGIINARERLDKRYIQRKYGLDDDNLDILEKNMSVKLGNRTHYSNFMDQLLSIDINDDNTHNWIEKQIDLQNFCTHFAFKIYTSEEDWPGNNIIYWRYKTELSNSSTKRVPYGLDGRWRWMNLDNDGAFSPDPSENRIERLFVEYDSIYNLELDEKIPVIAWRNTLFRTLVKNDEVRKFFLTRFSDLVNTAFKSERVLNLIDRFEKEYDQPDIENHINRWLRPISKTNWHEQIDVMRNFAEKRPNYCYNDMKESFNLGETDSVFLDVNDFNMGYIKINTMEINEKTPGVDSNQVYPWGGRYFVGLPATFIPIPRDEYKFAYWEIDGKKNETDTLVFDLSKRTSVKAYFEIDPNYIYNPEAAKIDICPYEFVEWNKTQAIGTYPDNMAFYYTRYPDSRPNGALEGIIDSILYDYSSKTRINGLGAKGLSLINTATANDYYYQTRLGAVAVAFSTIDIPGATVQFTAGTIQPKSKKYGIRLQYRFSDKGEVFDFEDENGNLIEYLADEFADHEQTYKVKLPDEFMNRKYVQLLWRYYFTGEQRFDDSEQRDELRVDDIIIKQNEIAGTQSPELYKKVLIGNPRGVSYQWYKCENDTLHSLNGETNQKLTITQPGTFALEVDYGDCKFISDCEDFYVKEHKDFYPSIHTTLIPNPSNGIFEIVFDEIMKDISVSVVDLTGKTVNQRFEKETQTIKYNLQKLSSGVYILDIKTKDGRNASEKIVIH